MHGLNSREVGTWVKKIFHKNDGYQTPIVINPYRDKGIIDINTENTLVRDRLMCNIIINEKLRKVTPFNEITLLKVKVKSRDYTLMNYIKIRDDFFSNTDGHYKEFNENLYEIFRKKNNFVNQEITFKTNKINEKCIRYHCCPIKKKPKRWLL